MVPCYREAQRQRPQRCVAAEPGGEGCCVSGLKLEIDLVVRVVDSFSFFPGTRECTGRDVRRREASIKAEDSTIYRYLDRNPAAP